MKNDVVYSVVMSIATVNCRLLSFRSVLCLIAVALDRIRAQCYGVDFFGVGPSGIERNVKCRLNL